ncbi:hypothetical protein Pfo_021932 [Paulownia fortunei]|nr:hypothetical protein Pfo_021932 [Paulownia fortunei]
MEIFGAFLDEEWESLSKMFSSGDNPDFLLHFNGSSLFPSNGEIPSTAFLASAENMAGVDESSYFTSDHTLDTNFCCISQESSNSSEIDRALFTNQGIENHQPIGVNFLHDDAINNSTFESMNFYNMDCNNEGLMVPVFPDDVMQEILHLKAEMCNDQWGNAETQPAETGDSCKEMQLKRKHEAPGIQTQDKGHAVQSSEDKSEEYSLESPKKKSRGSRNAHKNQRAVQSKKKKKVIQDNNNEEEINAGGNRQSSSSCTSEDDSNASQELNGGSTSESKGSACLNSNGKARASRGSATDPQSLYARRRRERINERLRILQNLVPNGTKVDISTMLEEAVQYVKFLQLQIKLLSSDDLWMYAPLAYNGMDIGIYQKISPNLWPQN